MTGFDGSIDTHGPDKQALISRVKGILLSPKSEWPVIDGESTTVGQLYAGYIAILSAIPPLATFIGVSVFGVSIPFIGTYRVPMGSAITSAITQYILGLVGVYVLALIIDALAPTFAGEKNLIQALKVAAYSYTAGWIAGIFALIPGLRLLGILGLYSFYLLYLGLPTLMKSPKEKAAGYSAVVVICAILLFWAVAAVGSAFISRPPVPGLG